MRFEGIKRGKKIRQEEVVEAVSREEEKSLQALLTEAIAPAVLTKQSTEVMNHFLEQLGGGKDGELLLDAQSEGGELCYYKVSLYADMEGSIALLCTDVTERRMEQLAREQWRTAEGQIDGHSIYTMEVNLTCDQILSHSGELILWSQMPEFPTFDGFQRYVAKILVHPDDKELFLASIDRAVLRAAYHRGKRESQLDFRQRDEVAGYRWVRMHILITRGTDNMDLLAQFVCRDINLEKRQELILKTCAQTDPLTGALNWESFSIRAEELIAAAHSGQTQHAFMMLNFDALSNINRQYGFAVGDQTLINLLGQLMQILHMGDFVGRMEKDIFVICLRDIPFDAAIEKRARQFCDLLQKRMGANAVLTVSIGVAVYPRDGGSFKEICDNAAQALAQARMKGAGHYAFYDCRNVQQEGLPMPPHPGHLADSDEQSRLVLIAGEKETDTTRLSTLFSAEEWNIVTATDGEGVMDAIRRYGAYLTLVVLGMQLPDMTAVDILGMMQGSPESCVIPVVVATESDTAVCHEVLKCGAADYISTSCTDELLRAVFLNVYQKTVNEKQRMQKTYLLLQEEADLCYGELLRITHTILWEFRWSSRSFHYSAERYREVSGVYDSRSLWEIWQADGVASADEIEKARRFMESMGERDMDEAAEIDLCLQIPGGEMHWFHFCVMRITDEAGFTKKLILTLNDMDTSIRSCQHLTYLAEHDMLTKLYNRPTFLKLVGQSVPESMTQWTLVSLYLEYFKVFNELSGAGKGDELLVAVADTLREFSTGKGVCCHMGMGQFALCIPWWEGVWQALEAAVQECLDYQHLPVRVLPVSGWYRVEDNRQSASYMLNCAETAMKKALDTPLVSLAFYDETMCHQTETEYEILTHMEEALENGEFVPWFQPQYDAETHRLTGAEVLVRWRKPDGTILEPSGFISVLEKTGFIAQIDFTMWRAACMQLRKWLDEGRKTIHLSVNISRINVYSEDLAQRMYRLIKEFELSPELLHLEITESAFIEQPGKLVEAIQKLRTYGFAVEIDDFGSGYSSLNMLKDVEINLIKLDMEFLCCRNKARGEKIIESMVLMANELDCHVLVEGVETKEQVESLIRLGCRYFQGYYFARPMPAKELECLLAEENEEFRSRGTSVP